jgi:hypothetical protein
MINNNINPQIALRQEIVESYNNSNSDILGAFNANGLDEHILRSQQLFSGVKAKQATLLGKKLNIAMESPHISEGIFGGLRIEEQNSNVWYTFRYQTRFFNSPLDSSSTAYRKLNEIVDNLPFRLDQGLHTYSVQPGGPRSHFEPVVQKGIEFGAGLIRDRQLFNDGEYLRLVAKSANSLFERISQSDIIFLSKLSEIQSKLIMIVLFPVLFQPLKLRLWGILYVMTLKYSKTAVVFLNDIVKNVCSRGILAVKTAYLNYSPTVTTKFIGFSSLTSFAFYRTMLFSTKSYMKSIPLYTGLPGLAGQLMGSLRLEGSKVIYEVAKTASTFSNAAVAGLLEPKQEAMRKVVKEIMSKSK